MGKRGPKPKLGNGKVGKTIKSILKIATPRKTPERRK